MVGLKERQKDRKATWLMKPVSQGKQMKIIILQLCSRLCRAGFPMSLFIKRFSREISHSSPIMNFNDSGVMNSNIDFKVINKKGKF